MRKCLPIKAQNYICWSRDIDDRELLAELTAETFRELPVSKPGKKKGKRAGKRQIRRQGQRKSNQFKTGEEGKSGYGKGGLQKRDKALYQPGRNP